MKRTQKKQQSWNPPPAELYTPRSTTLTPRRSHLAHSGTIALAREAMQGHPTASPMGSPRQRGEKRARKRPTHAPMGGYEQLKMLEELSLEGVSGTS